MGMAYINLQQPKDALQIFSKIEYPEKLEEKQYQVFFYNRGVAYLMNEEYQEALTDFNNCLEVNPKDEEAITNKIDTCLEIKKKDIAMKEIHKLEKITGETTETHFKKAYISQLRKDY